MSNYTIDQSMTRSVLKGIKGLELFKIKRFGLAKTKARDTPFQGQIFATPKELMSLIASKHRNGTLAKHY